MCRTKNNNELPETNLLFIFFHFINIKTVSWCNQIQWTQCWVKCITQLIILGHFSDYVFFRFIDAEKKDVLERASSDIIVVHWKCIKDKDGRMCSFCNFIIRKKVVLYFRSIQLVVSKIIFVMYSFFVLLHIQQKWR